MRLLYSWPIVSALYSQRSDLRLVSFSIMCADVSHRWSAKKDERERRFQEVCGGGAGTYVFSRRALGELRWVRAVGQLASVSTACACAIDLRLAPYFAVSQGPPGGRKNAEQEPLS